MTFPWWDEVDKSLLEKPDFFPVGTSESPYEAADEGWNVCIWQDGEYIYLLEGDDPYTTEFPTWFKVKTNTFTQEWKKIKEIVESK